MNIDLMPWFIVGIALVVIVFALALWRKVVASKEDDTLHVLADSSVIARQGDIAHKLDLIDRWGKLLTVIATAYLLIILAVYVYQEWVARNTPGI